MEDNKITFTGEFFLRDEHIQTQLYTQTFSERVVSIHMKTYFKRVEEKDFIQECSFTISPAGYVRAEFNSTMYGESVTMRIRKINNNKLEIYLNSVVKETIEVNENEIVLLDGPSPIFDYYNYMYFINSQNRENVERKVFQIECLLGKLIKKNYIYQKYGDTINIQKDEATVSIEFWEESYNLKKIMSKDSVCFFNR